MKTAISIPDDVFAGAERLASRTKQSRSQVYSKAVREYVARHSGEEITEAMNRVLSEIGSDRSSDVFSKAAAERTMRRVEW